MRRLLIFLILIVIICNISGCSLRNANANTNDTEDIALELPKTVRYSDDGTPVLDVYIAESGKVESMDLETYLQGVVAGEMANNWPIEALKAQAILARTYTLKFLETKKSKYEGADISTDVTEAQAYNADMINDNVRRAVEETRGIVMTYGDELPMAWFHAHSGGMTELPSVALEYKEDPAYLSAAASAESSAAPEDVQNWSVTFTADEVGKACEACGVNTGKCESISIVEKGGSGRAKSLSVNGKEVSAPSFRINIGADRLKSTLIDEIILENDTVTFTGRGYGHGVGMSQWGAHALAEKGATAQTIVSRYFSGVHFVDLW